MRRTDDLARPPNSRPILHRFILAGRRFSLASCRVPGGKVIFYSGAIIALEPMVGLAGSLVQRENYSAEHRSIFCTGRVMDAAQNFESAIPGKDDSISERRTGPRGVDRNLLPRKSVALSQSTPRRSVFGLARAIG